MTGAPGDQGIQGDAGTHGPAGPQGATGATGSSGAWGPAGERGAVGPRGQAGLPVDYGQFVDKVRPRIVKVGTADNAGTGFFIAPGCSVVTARHLLEMTAGRLHSTVSVTLRDGRVSTYTVRVPVSNLKRCAGQLCYH